MIASLILHKIRIHSISDETSADYSRLNGVPMSLWHILQVLRFEPTVQYGFAGTRGILDRTVDLVHTEPRHKWTGAAHPVEETDYG